MTTIHDSGPQELLTKPNYAVVATLNQGGSIHQTVVWVSLEGDDIAVNSAVGRLAVEP
jgi:Pyridoxamine 5'-phosphate oxidase